MSKKCGSIMVQALWILSLLLLMGTAISFRASMYLHMVKQYRHSQIGYMLARAGVNEALYHLMSQKTEITSTNQRPVWVNNPGLFQSIKMNSGTYSIRYEELEPDEKSPEIDEDKKYIYGIQDMERWININKMNAEFLEKSELLEEDYIDILLDWIDTDNDEKRNGAETKYYEELNPPYTSKNAPLEFTEELFLLKDYDSELITKITPEITVYGSGAVNFNTANARILKLLGLEDDLIDIILEFRLGNDGMMNTEDDPWINDPKDIERTLFEYEPLNAKEATQITTLISKNLLGTTSFFYRIESHGFPHGSSKPYKIICTVEIVPDEKFTILSWQKE